MTSRSLALGLALALAVAGCREEGGGAGAGSASVASTASGTNTGLDVMPPTVVVSQPARGAFLPAGPVQVVGQVTDSQSGVASVTVQGNVVQLDPQGNFSTTVTLDEGVAPIQVMATDNAGNRTVRTISVETGDYLPASQIVPDALTGRINSSGLALVQTIGANEIAALTSTLTTTLQAANPIFSGYGVSVSISSLSFGAPVCAITTSTTGLEIGITVPNLSAVVAASDSLGVPITTGTITADLVSVTAVVDPTAGSTGQLAVSFPTVDVAFQNFGMSLGGVLSFLGPTAGPLIEPVLVSQLQTLIQTDAPAELQKFLSQSTPLSLLGSPAVFSYFLDGVAADANGISFDVGINLELTPDPSYPASPGSLLSQGGLPTTPSTLPTADFSISETALNRILHQAWQSGLLETTITPASVAQSFGVALPIGETAQDLVDFLPALQGAIPGQYLASNIVYKVRPLLPPTLKLMSGVTDPLRLRFGEFDVTASVDEGSGAFLDVFTVAIYAEIQLGFAIENGILVPDMSTLATPLMSVDLISSPLVPLGAAYIESYFGGVIPVLMGGVVSNLPPIVLPALPAGVQLEGATFQTDGPNGTYLTIEMEIQ